MVNVVVDKSERIEIDELFDIQITQMVSGEGEIMASGVRVMSRVIGLSNPFFNRVYAFANRTEPKTTSSLTNFLMFLCAVAFDTIPTTKPSKYDTDFYG